MFATQSYHAQQKLQQLDTKITNKSQALQALKTSRKADPKVQLQNFFNNTVLPQISVLHLALKETKSATMNIFRNFLFSF